MPDLARRIVDAIPSSCVLTDAGSVKSGTVRDLEAIFGGRFVGSHPMAGSERSGLDAAREDLFQGAAAILTPTPRSQPAAVEAVRDLWQSVGCRVLEMSPAAHDDAVALVSHLPHAAASALVNAIHLRAPSASGLAGGGYRDTTRVAAGPPAMWSEILLENREPVLNALGDFSRTLDELQALLRAQDARALTAFLSRARDIRETLP